MAQISQRLRTHVRLWRGDRAEPMGSGFVLDERHIMTCAHVVGDCLGMRAVLKDSEVAPSQPVSFDMPMAPELSRRAVVVPEMWAPERLRARPEELARVDDVAVLRLVEDDVLPMGAEPVAVAADTNSMDAAFAFGTDPDLRDTSYVLGRLVEQVSLRRLKLVAEHPGVRPGCSGAAAWNVSRGGIAGMIAERSADANGLVIPAATLAEVWPGFASAGRAAAGRPARRQPARRLLRDELAQRICQLDRRPQASAFETMVIEDYDDQRRPMLCVIAGLDRDAPRLCRDKCRQSSLHGRLEGLGIPSRLVDARRLPWPEERRFDAGSAFARLRNMLGDELGARGDVSRIMSAYVGTGRPLILFSELNQASWGEDQRSLLEMWGRLWADFRSASCPLPLVHFLLVRLEDRRFNMRRPQQAYQRFEQFGREIAAATGGVAHALPPLEHLDLDEVESWIDALADEIDTDVDDRIRAKKAARRTLGAVSYPRLADLEAWIARLRI